MDLPRGAAVAAIIAIAALPVPGTAAAQYPVVSLIDTAVLAAPRLSESSGIVASRRHPGLFWTHNDSGDGPFLYVTDSTGADLGRLRVLGASAVDWEDISIGSCTRSAGTCLFIGDIGDNDARRPNISVYVVPEPDPATARAGTATAAVDDTLVLRYPDHPHDAESIAVIGGWLYLVTKDHFGPAVLFRTPTHTTGPRILERVGVLPIRTGLLRGRVATGAAASEDGSLLVVRTYVSLHFFSMVDGTPTPLTGRDGLGIPVVETQGEGVCFDARGRLVLTGERGGNGHAILVRLRISGEPSR